MRNQDQDPVTKLFIQALQKSRETEHHFHEALTAIVFVSWIFIVSLEEGKGTALTSVVIATKPSLPQCRLKTKWSLYLKVVMNYCGSLSCPFEVRGDDYKLFSKCFTVLSLNERL